MRLGLCSNRTCWALSIFYALVQYKIEFLAGNFVCWIPWISEIPRFSAPNSFLTALACKNKFLDLRSWLTCENSWATKLVSYWSTLLLWERCANHYIKPGELLNFLQWESCFGLQKNDEKVKKNARNCNLLG